MSVMVQVPFGHTRVSRIMPAFGAEHYKSFSVRAPLSSHWRRGTCEEFECNGWRSGWATTVDVSDDLGQRRYHFITHDKTRSHTVEHVGETLYRFTFGPGQTCYSNDEHRVPVGRPALLLVTGGDWRGNPRKTPARVHRTMDDFVSEFSEHQDRLAAAQR
jgi:hypothetical protein